MHEVTVNITLMEMTVTPTCGYSTGGIGFAEELHTASMRT